MSIKNLVGKRITKQYSFMGENITISKLTVGEIEAIQRKSKENENKAKEKAAQPAIVGADEEVDTSSLEMLRFVIELSCPEFKELSSEEFNSFALEELSTLSEEIMNFSGLGDKGK
jgi:hypothetical protein